MPVEAQHPERDGNTGEQALQDNAARARIEIGVARLDEYSTTNDRYHNTSPHSHCHLFAFGPRIGPIHAQASILAFNVVLILCICVT